MGFTGNMTNVRLGSLQGCSYGGRRQAGPPTTYDFRPAQKQKQNFRPAQIFFFFFFYSAWHYVS